MRLLVCLDFDGTLAELDPDPYAAGRRTSRLLATSRSSVSIPAPVTASAADTVEPPANTAKRAKQACSSSLSNPWLQSVVARSVR